MSVFPFKKLNKLFSLVISKTLMGILFSLHKVIAVRSIIANSFSKTSEKVIDLNLLALGLVLGSVSNTPSTLVPLINKSQFNSAALKAAALSVLKKGFPVPPAIITILPLSKCLIALLLIYGSAIFGISIQDSVRVSHPTCLSES